LLLVVVPVSLRFSAVVLPGSLAAAANASRNTPLVEILEAPKAGLAIEIAVTVSLALTEVAEVFTNINEFFVAGLRRLCWYFYNLNNLYDLDGTYLDNLDRLNGYNLHGTYNRYRLDGNVDVARAMAVTAVTVAVAVVMPHFGKVAFFVEVAFFVIPGASEADDCSEYQSGLQPVHLVVLRCLESSDAKRERHVHTLLRH